MHSRHALTVDKHRSPQCAVVVARQAAQASRTSAEKFLGALTAPVHLYADRFFPGNLTHATIIVGSPVVTRRTARPPPACLACSLPVRSGIDAPTLLNKRFTHAP